MTRLRIFTPDEIERCKAAMTKEGPMEALRTIASGRVIVEVSPDGRSVLIDRFNGRAVRDPDHPGEKMGLAGSRPLFAAGMIDAFGVITPAGRARLREAGSPDIPERESERRGSP